LPWERRGKWCGPLDARIEKAGWESGTAEAATWWLDIPLSKSERNGAGEEGGGRQMWKVEDTPSELVICLRRFPSSWVRVPPGCFLLLTPQREKTVISQKKQLNKNESELAGFENS
jgi:hypothetical protein